MARTKVTARISTGGRAILKRLPPRRRRGAGLREPTAANSVAKILARDPCADLEDVLTVLATLEGVRPSSCVASLDELVPQLNPRQAYFDTASVPPAWTSESICDRCWVLHELMVIGECLVQASGHT